MKIYRLIMIVVFFATIHNVSGQKVTWDYSFFDNITTIANYSNGVIVGLDKKLLKITKDGKIFKLIDRSGVVNEPELKVIQVLVDSGDNIYLLYNYDNCYTKAKFRNTKIYTGTGILKLDTTGKIIWNAMVGKQVSGTTILLSKRHLFVVGKFIFGIMMGNKIPMRPAMYIHIKRDAFNHVLYQYDLFAAKFSLDGEVQSAVIIKNGFDDEISSADIDKNGNIFLEGATRNTGGFIDNTVITKIDSNLNVVWVKKIPNNPGKDILHPRQIHCASNGKVYGWFYSLYKFTYDSTNLLENGSGTDSTNSVIGTSIIEFDPANGNINKAKSFPGSTISYMADYDEHSALILTAITDTMQLGGENIIPIYYSEESKRFNQDLILYKLNTDDFSTKFISQFNGDKPELLLKDMPGPIIYRNGVLYITATIKELQLNIFGTVVKNKSDNWGTNGIVVRVHMD